VTIDTKEKRNAAAAFTCH